MRVAELLPGDDPCRILAKPCAGVAADEPEPPELLPPGLCLTVVHDEVGVAQVPGRSEVERPRADPSIEDERGVAERTERDSDRDAGDAVVDDLVPDQDLDRIGSHAITNGELDYRLARLQKADAGDTQEAGVIDRGNPVLARPARLELGKRDDVAARVRLPTGEYRGRVARRSRSSSLSC